LFVERETNGPRSKACGNAAQRRQLANGEDDSAVELGDATRANHRDIADVAGPIERELEDDETAATLELRPLRERIFESLLDASAQAPIEGIEAGVSRWFAETVARACRLSPSSAALPFPGATVAWPWQPAHTFAFVSTKGARLEQRRHTKRDALVAVLSIARAVALRGWDGGARCRHGGARKNDRRAQARGTQSLTERSARGDSWRSSRRARAFGAGAAIAAVGADAAPHRLGRM
jgi:hypothetical protein